LSFSDNNNYAKVKENDNEKEISIKIDDYLWKKVQPSGGGRSKTRKNKKKLKKRKNKSRKYLRKSYRRK
jgi:hypothetical protein